MTTETKPDVPEAKFDKDELLKIFDEMIFSGEYTEEVTIRGRLKVVFKAKTVEDNTAISKEIDSSNYNLLATLQEHRALLSLAYSLVGYSGKDLSQVKIEERRKVIDKLPTVVVSLLSNALVTFDSKIDAACQEGEANF